ncbi:MAG: cob(I)yrinic acid a,c-diamide adenosyltransferase [Candidatus Omnitrophota bacterium]
MIHCYIGNGKGKTTAALGLALRASGWGRRVYVAQFLKDIKYPCGEIRAVRVHKAGIVIERFKNQIHPMFLKNQKVNTGQIKKSIERSLTKIESFIRTKKFDMIVFDEILDAIAEGFVASKKVTDILKRAHAIEVVVTGRRAPSEILRLADYVSYVEKVKHPFDKKCVARQGVEY